MKYTLLFLHLAEVYHGLTNFVAACAVDDYGQAFLEAIPMLLHVLKIVTLWTR